MVRDRAFDDSHHVRPREDLSMLSMGYIELNVAGGS
jgi:hypothetical protein